MCIVNILFEFPLIPSGFPQSKECGYTVHIKKKKKSLSEQKMLWRLQDTAF